MQIHPKVWNGTEPEFDNAHCGEKSDEFGSKTELTINCRVDNRAYCPTGRLGVTMRASLRTSVAERARWLAELAAAVDEAQALLWRIGVLEGDDVDAKELYGRLEFARSEIECLRGVRELGAEALDPEWMKLFLWDPLAADPAS